jgi:hypothetical protein
MANKTQSELRTHTRVYLDETSEADWKDSQINRALNYAYMELFAAVVETYEDYYRTKAVTGLVASQQEYALPDGFYKVRRIEVKYSSDDPYNKANPFNFDQQRRSLSDVNAGSTSDPEYYLNGSFLGLVPIPSQDVTAGLLMWYIKQPDAMDEDDDFVNIPFPERYAGLIPLGAAAELLRKGQQEEAVASKYLEDFRIGLEKMKQELEDRYADGSKSIVDTLGDWNDFSGPSSTTITIN